MKKITSKANTVAASNENPYGSIRDKTVSQAGTPVNTDVYSDAHVMLQALMDGAAVSPNDKLDNGANGIQLINALGSFIHKTINPELISFFSGSNQSDLDNNWKGMVYGNGYIMRCGARGSVGYIARTLDGESHDVVFQASNIDFFDISFGNGLFVALRETTSGNFGNFVSTDNGATWNTAFGINYVGTAKANCHVSGNIFAFILTNGSDTEFSSYDVDGGGLQQQTTISNFVAEDIIYNDGRYIMVGQGSTTTTNIKTSTDGGVTWSDVTHPANNNPFVKVYFDKIYESYSGNNATGYFYAITDNSVDSSTVLALITSDASSVVTRILNDKEYKDVQYGNGKFVMIAVDDPGGLNLEQFTPIFGPLTELTTLSPTLSGSVTTNARMIYANGKFLFSFYHLSPTPFIV